MRQSARIRRVFLAAVCLCAVASEVCAQDASDEAAAESDAAGKAAAAGKPWMAGTTREQRRAASVLFEEGNALMDEFSFADAEKKYQAAIEKWPHPVFYFNRTIAQINLLQPIEAYESITKALQYGEAPFDPAQYQRALDYKKTLENSLAHVRIECAQAGVEVTLDGQVLFTGPGEYASVIRPGSHQLVATREGYTTETRSIVGDAGQKAEVQLRLKRPPRIVSVRKWAVWKPWAVVAGGAVMLGTAGFMDWSSSQQFADYDAQLSSLCPAPDGCLGTEISANLSGTLSGARSRQWVARVSYGVAGAALATGAVLLYLNRERLIEVTETSDAAAQMTVVPVVTGHGWGIQAGFSF